MINSTTKTIAAAFSIAAALGATTVQSASAKGGDGVRVAGKCSVNSTSKLKVKHDNRRLEVEFEVDQNRTGVPWAVEIRQDGRLVVQATRTTLAPSGSFSLGRHIAGTKGTITARAVRAGETCTASAQAGNAVNAANAVQTTTTVAQVGDDKGNDGVGHDVNDDKGGHSNDD
jgi:hypothetical protein